MGVTKVTPDRRWVKAGGGKYRPIRAKQERKRNLETGNGGTSSLSLKEKREDEKGVLSPSH